MGDDPISAGPDEAGGTAPWSHNAHYHRLILGAVPARCERALDVGCGTGALTRRLRRVVPQVTGIDRDQRSIEAAAGHPGAAGIGYVLADFRAAPFGPGSLDLITSVAALHHMDAGAALTAMAGLLRPGGVVAVVGLARGSSPADLAWCVPAVTGTRLRLLATAHGQRNVTGQAAAEYQPPVTWPPPLTYRGMRRLASQILPGVRYTRHLYWRYSLTWTKPL
jgi:SAM-dependent methyltransferase